MTTQLATITYEQAIALCHRDEDEFFDRKAPETKGRAVQKAAVAFGNTEGGEIAFGIRDDSDEPSPERRLAPFNDPEDANGILQAIYEVQPPLTFRYSFLRIENKQGVILRVFIDKGQHVHATSDGTIYKRLGASSVSVKDPNEITRMSFAKGAISYENVKLNGTKSEEVVETEEAVYLTT